MREWIIIWTQGKDHKMPKGRKPRLNISPADVRDALRQRTKWTKPTKVAELLGYPCPTRRYHGPVASPSEIRRFIELGYMEPCDLDRLKNYQSACRQVKKILETEAKKDRQLRWVRVQDASEWKLGKGKVYFHYSQETKQKENQEKQDNADRKEKHAKYKKILDTVGLNDLYISEFSGVTIPFEDIDLLLPYLPALAKKRQARKAAK